MFSRRPSLVKPSTSDEYQKQRSKRFIKRKKFDDEVVESSLTKKRTRVSSQSASQSSEVPQFENIPIAFEKRTKPRSQRRDKLKKEEKSEQHPVVKEECGWQTTDDLLLILSMQQINNLDYVFLGVEFSKNFMSTEVKDRWRSILYNSEVSESVAKAIKQLPFHIVAKIQQRVLFSEAEEQLLTSVPSTEDNIETFQKLKDSNPFVFLPYRTAKCLLNYWKCMKHYKYLEDQRSELPAFAEDLVLSISDIEDDVYRTLDEYKVTSSDQRTTEGVLYDFNRVRKYRIKKLENELPKWQVLVESVADVRSCEFDNNSTLAILKGSIVRYLIQSKYVSLGRPTQDISVDIDLSLEGPASKISSKQGSIKIDSNFDFYLYNEAKKPVFVDGVPVLFGNKCKIGTNSVIEVSILRFVFIVNQVAISSLKASNM